MWSHMFKKRPLAESGSQHPDGPQGEVSRMTCVEDALMQKRDIRGFLTPHEERKLRRLRNTRLSLEKRESLASINSDTDSEIST